MLIDSVHNTGKRKCTEEAGIKVNFVYDNQRANTNKLIYFKND